MYVIKRNQKVPLRRARLPEPEQRRRPVKSAPQEMVVAFVSVAKGYLAAYRACHDVSAASVIMTDHG